ncbi:MAG TPA: M48 family metallopeptidase [Verrucomicrobiae bacterium]
MELTNRIAAMTAGLILAKGLMELWLSFLNRRHVLAHAGAVPEALKTFVDAASYAKSVEYTLARGRLGWISDGYGMVVLLGVLFSGILPWALRLFEQHWGVSAWAMAAFLFAVGVAMSLPGLPVDWWEQFRLEQRFGFNTTTQKTWWLDRVKGLLLAAALGYPLLVLVLKIVEWTGHWWWVCAWGALIGFQLLLLVLGPALIMPLFNKFTPLPDGSLRDRLLGLAERTRFRARSIQVMDGSKRSRHSNAFFTGLGRFRRIVLFDTLIQQLTEPELEAVLAHEIGHYKLRHIVRLLAVSAATSLAGFYALSLLARQGWFCRAFGFETDHLAPTLLLFGLLAGVVTFWLSPGLNWWSRRHEYQADAFAARTLGGSGSLVAALRKLNEKNLSNLTPHPLYSGFYYSHPTLLEREAALARVPCGNPSQRRG